MKIALEQVLLELLPQGPTPKPDELEITDLFKQLWPDQQSNLVSYRSKPDCGCKNAMMGQMALTPEKLETFLDRLKALRGKTFLYSGDAVPPQPVAGGIITEGNQSIAPPKIWHLAGQTRKIPNAPEAYMRLLADLRKQGGRFTGLSVVVSGQDLLVFFY